MLTVLLNVGYDGDVLDTPIPEMYTVHSVTYDPYYFALQLDTADDSLLISMDRSDYEQFVRDLFNNAAHNQTFVDLTHRGAFAVYPDEGEHGEVPAEFVTYLENQRWHCPKSSPINTDGNVKRMSL